MPRKQWVFDPDSGGKKIPEAVKGRTEARIRRFAQAHFAGRYTRLEVRFRGQLSLTHKVPAVFAPDFVNER
jgi:hypothetical protein